LETAADAVKATSAIIRGVAAGDITLSEAGELAKLVGEFTKVLDLHEIQQRLAKLEAAQETKR